MLDLLSRPKMVDDQFEEQIGDSRAYYNPVGYGGLSVLSGASLELAQACDGFTTVQALIFRDGRPEGIVLAELEDLVDHQVVEYSAERTAQIVRCHERPPSASCWLHLTNRCNLACSYCYIYKTKGDLRFDQAIQYLTSLVSSCELHGIKRLNVKLSGGEPILRFRMLRELIRYASTLRSSVSIGFTLLSNGTLISPSVAEFLSRNNVGVAVSLDGLKEINDSSRFDIVGNGSFERVVRGIQSLREAGISPVIMTTITAKNLFGLADLTAFFLENQLRFRFSLERDSAQGRSTLLSHEDELVSVLMSCYDYVEQHLPSSDFLRFHHFGDVQFRRPARRACGAGSSFFAIGHDGSIGLCGMGLHRPFARFAEISEDLLGGVRRLNSELGHSSASDYGDCNECLWRHSCAASCPLETKLAYGDFAHRSPYCKTYSAVLPRILHIRALQLIQVGQQRKARLSEGGEVQ